MRAPLTLTGILLVISALALVGVYDSSRGTQSIINHIALFVAGLTGIFAFVILGLLVFTRSGKKVKDDSDLAQPIHSIHVPNKVLTEILVK